MKSFLFRSSDSGIFAMLLFFSACSGKSDNNKALIEAVQESMENSNSSININSMQIIHSLDEKSRDYSTKERAEIWLSKAKKIQKLSEEIFNYIEELKKTNMINAETANELYLRLSKHKEDILSIDSSMKQVFEKKFILISGTFDTGKQTENDFYKTFFRNAAALSTSAMLTKLQNNIKLIEIKTVTYCHDMIGKTDGDGIYTSYQAIVGQSSSYVKAGEKIEISAGIGSFSNQVRPVITINRNNVSPGETGLAIYSFNASDKPGKYFVPVKIEFDNQEGQKMIQEFTVEYTVAKECDQ